MVKKYVIQRPFRQTFFWPLIEAKYLRGGLAGKAAAKNTTRSIAQAWRFFKRHLPGLSRRRGVNLPQQRLKEPDLDCFKQSES